jgi:quercetin dioxygenase-like cupin family protein
MRRVFGRAPLSRASRSRKRGIAAAVGVVVIGTFSAVALASAPSNSTTTVLATGNLDNSVQVNTDRVKFQTKDPTVVRVQKVVFGPGGSSGWRHRPGVAIVTVAAGAVTVWESDCSTTTYGPGLPAGPVFIESGDDPGQVTSVDGATTYATLVVPNDDPPVFRIDDTPPPCAADAAA